MDALTEWASLLLRFAHVLAGIMWIGESLYFMWLDFSMQRPDDADSGAPDPHRIGYVWMLHGGNAYRADKVVLQPERLPRTLHWFKWESYTTWITGFCLIMTFFYARGGGFLLLPGFEPSGGAASLMLALGLFAVGAGFALWKLGGAHAALPAVLTAALCCGGMLTATPEHAGAFAIHAGLVALGSGWLIYDMIWRSPLQRAPMLGAALTFLMIPVAAFLLTRIFNGRAAFIHLGAMLGTIMSANVFFHIMPGQHKFMGKLLRGAPHDLEAGKRAKFRSMSNNYLTFPVLMLMLSSHFTFLTGHWLSWIAFTLLAIMLAAVKHFMNIQWSFRHWIAGAAISAVLGVAATAGVLAIPAPGAGGGGEGDGASGGDDAALAQQGAALLTTKGCAACHAGADSATAPTLHGIWDQAVPLTTGRNVLADEAYLAESISNPNAKIVRGYQPNLMPQLQLSDAEVAALIAHIKSLARQ